MILHRHEVQPCHMGIDHTPVNVLAPVLSMTDPPLQILFINRHCFMHDWVLFYVFILL